MPPEEPKLINLISVSGPALETKPLESSDVTNSCFLAASLYVSGTLLDISQLCVVFHTSNTQIQTDE